MTTQTSTDKTSKRATLVTIINGLSIIIAIIALLVSAHIFYVNLKNQEEVTALNNHIQDQQIQIKKISEHFSDQEKHMKALDTAVANLTATLDQNRQSESLRRYYLGNIEHLIQLANQVLLIDRDTVKAVHLLEDASAAIVKLNDPITSELGEQVTKDIAALKAVDVINGNDIYEKIGVLIVESEKLSVAPSLKFSPVERAEHSQQNISMLDNVINWLNQYIRIQKHTSVATPLLTPEEASYVKHNIVVLLEQAQWSVLHHESHTYQVNLERVEKLIVQYGVKEDSVVQAFLSNLTTLKKINITPELPDISTSLPLLEKIAAPKNSGTL